MKKMKKLVAIIIAVLITTWVSMSNQVFAADALTIGKKYYYKVKLAVYDVDGKLAAETTLKQSAAGVRTFKK